MLVVVSKRRYTDVWHRTRRAQPLSDAAEAQWDLLPPLTCSTDEVALSGILEPAYEIGGDSFDYALNPGRLEFAIVDATGHGMPAVLMSIAAINSLRNTRREQASLEAAYRQVDRIIAAQFGHSFYVTGQIASLDLASGVLTWLNAGHPLPMLVRDGSYVGELQCRPSIPMGLGGPVVEVATQQLQRGDRVLFYTDGITEPLSPDGERFGCRPARGPSRQGHARWRLGDRDGAPSLYERHRPRRQPRQRRRHVVPRRLPRSRRTSHADVIRRGDWGQHRDQRSLRRRPSGETIEPWRISPISARIATSGSRTTTRSRTTSCTTIRREPDVVATIEPHELPHD